MSEDFAEPGQFQVDLTNCDREPIHILGQVQDYGCLIAMSKDWQITHASDNCQAILGHGASDLIGTMLIDLLPHQSVHHLRTQMQVLNHKTGTARVFAFPLFDDGRHFDVSIHQSGDQIVFEFEPRPTPVRHVDDTSAVQVVIDRVQRHSTLDKMAHEAARGLKMLCGFDRVMVYKFEADDSGTVIAEAREPGQEPFLGLRYPASDIPKQARALYLRSPLRIIADVNGPTHGILGDRDHDTDPLDLSLAVTRAVSPIHLEYLRNMEVSASMSVSIIRDGKLWGLFACHHHAPRYIDYEKRTSVELLAQLFTYELAQHEMRRDMADLDRARALHDGLMAKLSDGRRIIDDFEELLDDIHAVIPFDGAALYSDGHFRSKGATPTQFEFLDLTDFLNRTPAGQIFVTDALSQTFKAAAGWTTPAAGILALPLSRTPRDYLVLFRQEMTQTVTWAGHPDKAVVQAADGPRMSPRKSFEAWTQIVRGRSAPWKDREQRAADALRVTMLEVVLKMSDENNAARKRAQDRQELLIAELNHRVRNILNLIRGLVSQSDDGALDVAGYRAVLESRIHALSRAHDQLTQKEWDWVSLNSLIDTEVHAFLAGRANRVEITGDAIELTPTAFSTMALVAHELVTNSAKYGALGTDKGRVEVAIALTKEAATVTWRDIGGPPVAPPTRKGFGTTIIERSIPYELNGTAETRYRVTGFEADFTLPVSYVRLAQPTPQDEAPAVAPGAAPDTLTGQVLLVEDNLIIAMDAVDMLTDLGADAVRSASRVSDALTLLDDTELTLALVDLNLGDELSTPVVQRCRERGLPVILATGYGPSTDLMKQFPDVPILKKPYTIEHLRAILSSVTPPSA